MSSRGHLQVLLLEEQRALRLLVVEMLHELGFHTVVEAVDGQAGLDALERHRDGFDLVLCNLEMSGMDGLEFIRHAPRLGVGGLVLYAQHDDAVLSSAEWMARAYCAPLLGVLRAPFERCALESLVNRLDGACTVYSDVMGRDPDPEDGDRTVLEEIRAALDTGQFVPHYQPKVCLATGHLLGVETLARWEHPQLGLVAPVHFVDLMERNDLIDPLTHALLGQAARQVLEWERAGLAIKIAINISPLSLERPNCAKELLATIAATGAHPSQFVFEITEKAFAKNGNAVLENVLRLRMRGCGIAVDDFGTGYSSLQQLNRTPITELKLDRSFVRRITSNAKALSIVGSMIDLSRKLKLRTVAEGVDTDPQRERLVELGCDMGQGFLFARAMDGAQLMRWASARQPAIA